MLESRKNNIVIVDAQLISVSQDLKVKAHATAETVNSLLDYELFLSEFNKAWKLICETKLNGRRLWIAGYGELSYPASCFNGSSAPVSYDCLMEQLRTLAKQDDCIVIFSTTGGSDQIIDVARLARELGLVIITFTGYPGAPLSSFGEARLKVPLYGDYKCESIVLEVHQQLFHIILKRLEEYFK